MPLPALATRLFAGFAVLLLAAGLAASREAPGAEKPSALPAADVLTTAEYLEMPEIFQITLVSGSMAMLKHLGPRSDVEKNCACFARWGAHEDVVALVSLHVQRNPAALDAAFADTLLEAMTERCRPAD